MNTGTRATTWPEQAARSLSGERLTALAGALGLLLLGAAIAWLPLQLGVAAVAGGIGLLTLLIHPLWGLYALVFAIPFGALRGVSLGGLTIGAVEALTAAIIACWLARQIARREIRLHWPPLTVPLLILLGAMAFSLTITASLTQSLIELAKWVEVLALYVLIANGIRPKAALGLVLCLLLAGSAEALLGLYQFVFRVGPEGFLLMGRFMRAYGTFQQPNPYAGYLGLQLPLACGLLAVEGRGLWEGWRRRHGLRLLVSWVALGSLALMALALAASWSRGGWLGFAVAVAAMAVALNRRALAVAAAVAAALVVFAAMGGLALLPPALVQRVTDTLPYAAGLDIRAVEVDDANWALVERMAHWQAAWEMFAAHPWRGVGLGNYAVAYPAYALPRWQDPLGHAHNYYLNILAETGLVGLAAFAIFWLAALAQAIRALRRCRGYARGLALAALGMLAHLTVHNAFDNLFVQGMYLQLAFVLGALHALTRLGPQSTALSAAPGGPACASD